METNCKAAVTP